MKFTELAKSLKETGPEAVYLVDGEEIYFRDHAVRDITAACGILNPALNDTSTNGEGLKGEKLTAFLSTLYALPFLDARRLVRLTEFYPSERDFELFRRYLERPSETTTLVILNGGKKANTVDLKRKKGITHVDCSRADEETLCRWLFALMRRSGLKAESDALPLMVRYCNSDAARMKLETEKLRLILGADGTVTRKAVDEYIAKDAEYKVYELTQAASQKNADTFFEILGELESKGFDENAALSALTAHFKQLAEIGALAGSDAELSKLLGMHPYAVKRTRETARRLGAARCAALYEGLYRLSCGAKGGLYTKTGALYTAIAELFFA